MRRQVCSGMPVASTTWTRGPQDNSPAASIGQELASMLMGIPGGSMSVTASSALQNNFIGLYFQDDVRLTSRLTLNLGLRWDYESPLTERYNRLVAGFDFTTPNPIEAQAKANYARNPIPELPAANFRTLGGLTWVNQGNTGRSPFRSEKNTWMPRIGFAYQANDKTIVRGGYGIFYTINGIYNIVPIQTGFSQSTPIQASLDSGQTYIATTANPFPRGLTQPAALVGHARLKANGGRRIEQVVALLAYLMGRDKGAVRRVFVAERPMGQAQVAGQGAAKPQIIFGEGGQGLQRQVNDSLRRVAPETGQVGAEGGNKAGDQRAARLAGDIPWGGRALAGLSRQDFLGVLQPALGRVGR